MYEDENFLKVVKQYSKVRTTCFKPIWHNREGQQQSNAMDDTLKFSASGLIFWRQGGDSIRCCLAQQARNAQPGGRSGLQLSE